MQEPCRLGGVLQPSLEMMSFTNPRYKHILYTWAMLVVGPYL